jgi:hypothetical protein
MQNPMRRTRPKKGTPPVHVLFDRRVFGYMVQELAKCPTVEEGGKYVGYCLSASDPRLRALDLRDGIDALVVTDFLPSGPRAIRTAVELQPDGEYQEALFRRLEQSDPAIEHMGTWHSHHCNGLPTLSGGDIEGYLRTVNRREYRLDFFLASLVTRLPHDADATGWIDHYLFIRGDKDYYRITDAIQLIDWPTSFGAHTGHLPQVRTSRRSQEISDNPHRPADEKPAAAWYETTDGRAALAEDKRFFKATFEEPASATRRASQITLTGRKGRAAVSLTYPANPADTKVGLTMKHADLVIFEISCDLRWRHLAVSAALAAIERLGDRPSGLAAVAIE